MIRSGMLIFFTEKDAVKAISNHNKRAKTVRNNLQKEIEAINKSSDSIDRKFEKSQPYKEALKSVEACSVKFSHLEVLRQAGSGFTAPAGCLEDGTSIWRCKMREQEEGEENYNTVFWEEAIVQFLLQYDKQVSEEN